MVANSHDDLAGTREHLGVQTAARRGSVRLERILALNADVRSQVYPILDAKKVPVADLKRRTWPTANGTTNAAAPPLTNDNDEAAAASGAGAGAAAGTAALQNGVVTIHPFELRTFLLAVKYNN